MLRYRLDDLGAYQFEKLAQSALKVRAGLSVESWGNRGDWGRDSYTPSPLRFRILKSRLEGRSFSKQSLSKAQIQLGRSRTMP